MKLILPLVKKLKYVSFLIYKFVLNYFFIQKPKLHFTMIMQKLNYVLCLFLLGFTMSCSSTTKEDNEGTENTVEVAETNTTEITSTQDNTEAITKLRAYMKSVDEGIDSEEYKEDYKNEGGYTVSNYLNKEGKLVKRVVNVSNEGEDRWTTYYKPTSENSRAAYTMYSSSKIDPVTNRTTLIQFLSVGSLDENAKETRMLVVEGQNTILEGERLENYNKRYEEAKQYIAVVK